MAEYEINLENLVKMKRVFEVRGCRLGQEQGHCSRAQLAAHLADQHAPH